MIGSFAYPLVVEPVFNRFTPMPAGALREEILALAARDGVAVDDVLVADASRRTTAVNAYVSGFGSSRRVVLYDTLLATGHAAGGGAHRRPRARARRGAGRARRHAARRARRGGGGVRAGAAAAVVSVLRRSGADGMHDPRVVPLRARAWSRSAPSPSGPSSNLVSRRIEARADVHSLDLTRDPRMFVDSQRRLALTNLSDLDPDPMAYALFATHPSPTERLAMVREWERLRG